jgi:trimethylamine--corrinoid protein Co-methyltransferase
LVRKAGANISDGNRVRFPTRLVEQALSTVPKSLTLFNRNGEEAMRLEGSNTYYGPGSDCLNIIDHRTGKRRGPVLQDVADAARVCDALRNISFAMSMFFPSDMPQEIADRYQLEAMLHNTTKPIVFVTYDTSGCIDAITMGEAVAGGAEGLRQKPFLACYINATSGLLHNAEALEKLLFLSGKGLPSLYIPVVSGGTTGPVTMAGGLALSNAGVLVGLIVSQLKREGAPVVIPGFGGDALDMRTMVDAYCGPDPRGMPEALAHFYQLPMLSLGGASESKWPDQQAGIEAALDMLINAVCGGHLVHDCGYLESGLTGSLVQLAVCNEVAGWIRHACQPVEISAETLALDLIDEVGPDGQFLKLPHTRRHTPERWYPALFDRDTYSGWQARSGKDLAERATEQVSNILETHHCEPLNPVVSAAIHKVVERARVKAVDSLASVSRTP